MVSIRLCRKPENCIFCKEQALALIAENPVCLKHLKKISTDLQISDECKEFVHNYLQERARNDLYNLVNSSFKHERTTRKRSDLSSYLIKKYAAKKPKSLHSQTLNDSKRETPHSVLESL